MREIYYLNNGVKLIHNKIESPVSHFGVIINAGTRDEDDNKEGLAHFVEHTIFKGTKHRKNYQILKRMEDVGGEINASTSKEETCFYTSFLSLYYHRAIELFADILYNSTFPEKELEKEKDVIFEEINYYNDTPSELIFDEFETLLFANHPLGRSILGTKKNVAKFTKNDIQQFISSKYLSNNIVLSSVGNIDIKQLFNLCNKYFGRNEMKTGNIYRKPFLNFSPKYKKVKTKNSQANLIIGTETCSIYNQDKIVLHLIASFLGGQGLNTRLNMKLREKLGLVYTIDASSSQFSDTGFFSIYAGCDNQNIDKCITEIHKELNKIKNIKLGTIQLQCAKRQYIGQLAISNESKLNEMLYNGRLALFFEKVDDFEDIIMKIENISSEEILNISNKYLNKDQFSTLIFCFE